jgi:DNA-binding PadR family transcriptional regulator
MSQEPIEARQGGEDPVSSRNEGETSRAHKSLAYELFVLGELMDGPHHGYKLREILGNLLGPFRQISWGVLYPLIRQLEREELLTSGTEAVPEERKPGGINSRQQKRYTITATGRERFYALMLEQGDYNAEYHELFIIKLNNFDHLSPEQQLTVLWQYWGYLQTQDLYLRGAELRVSTDADIPDDQRAHILHIIRFRCSGIRGEMPWIEEQIRRVEEQAEET